MAHQEHTLIMPPFLRGTDQLCLRGVGRHNGCRATARDSALAHARSAGAKPPAEEVVDWLARIRPSDFGDTASR